LRRDIAERTFVGGLGILLCLLLCSRLLLFIHFAVFGDGLVLGEGRPGQEGHDHCGGDNSHARAPRSYDPRSARGPQRDTATVRLRRLRDFGATALTLRVAGGLPSRSPKGEGWWAAKFELPTLSV